MEDETWRDIPGYEGHYQASNQGNVRRIDEKARRDGKPLRPGSVGPKHIHFRVSLLSNGKKNYSVHRLVALAFLGPIPDDCDVHHINGNPTDNRPANLQYLDKAIHRSLHNHGEGHGMAVLSESDVLEIRARLAQGCHHLDLAQQYGVNEGTIRAIHVRRSWKHLK